MIGTGRADEAIVKIAALLSRLGAANPERREYLLVFVPSIHVFTHLEAGAATVQSGNVTAGARSLSLGELWTVRLSKREPLSS